MRTPESLMRPMPSSASVWARTTSTASSAAAACLEIRAASATIVMRMAAATAITTTPSVMPTIHSVDATVVPRSDTS
jgi:hypothetical protein